MQPQYFQAEKFAAALRARRGTHSLREVAAQLGSGVSASTLSRLENGKQPDLITAVAVCAWLGQPVINFIASTPDAMPPALAQALSAERARIELLRREAERFTELANVAEHPLNRALDRYQTGDYAPLEQLLAQRGASRWADHPDRYAD